MICVSQTRLLIRSDHKATVFLCISYKPFFNRLLRQQPGVINFVDRNGYWNLFDRSIKALRLGKPPFSILETTFKNVSGDGSAASPFQGVVIP